MLVLGPSLNERKSSRDKANMGNPKANRGCPPSTVNLTSTVCKTHEDPDLAVLRWGTLILEGSTLWMHALNSIYWFGSRVIYEAPVYNTFLHLRLHGSGILCLFTIWKILIVFRRPIALHIMLVADTVVHHYSTVQNNMTLYTELQILWQNSKYPKHLHRSSTRTD